MPSPGKDVLDAGADLLVGLVVGGFPARQFLVLAAPSVRNHQPRSAVAAVRDGHRLPDRVLGSGFGPCPSVMAVARQWLPDHDDQAGIGVDDHLVVRGVAVILGLLGDLVVTGGHQNAVHDEHGVTGEALARLHRELRSEVVDHWVGGRLRDSK